MQNDILDRAAIEYLKSVTIQMGRLRDGACFALLDDHKTYISRWTWRGIETEVKRQRAPVQAKFMTLPSRYIVVVDGKIKSFCFDAAEAERIAGNLSTNGKGERALWSDLMNGPT